MGAPLTYVVNAPRTSELVAWLKCNDVDPRDVPYPCAVFVETPDGEEWFVRFDVYVRNEFGAIRYDAATLSFEYAERSVPMLNDPPMWWLEEAPSTGAEGASAGPAGAESTAGEDTVAERAHDCA